MAIRHAHNIAIENPAVGYTLDIGYFDDLAPADPNAFGISRSDAGGYGVWMPKANTPQFVMGSGSGAGSGYIDVSNNRPLNLNVLDTGTGTPAIVNIGTGGLDVDGDAHIVGITTVDGNLTMTDGELHITSFVSDDNIKIEKTNSASHWVINAGRFNFFDNWLMWKNENETEAFTMALTNTGSFRGLNGVAGSPTYGFRYGSNYGMYFNQGTTTLAFTTAGIPRLQIAASGLIDVGSTSNYETLVVNDDDVPNAKYVNDRNQKLFCAYDATGGQSLTAVATTLNLDTTSVSDANYSLASDEITFNSDGDYKITIDISTADTDTVGGARACIDVQVEVDTGGGYNPITQAFGTLYHRETTCGGLSITFGENFSNGDKIRIQLTRSVGTTNIETTQNANRITIEKKE